MNILLDTQALIWVLNDSHRLTTTARQFIQEANTVYVTPVNFSQTHLACFDMCAVMRFHLIQCSIAVMGPAS